MGGGGGLTRATSPLFPAQAKASETAGDGDGEASATPAPSPEPKSDEAVAPEAAESTAPAAPVDIKQLLKSKAAGKKKDPAQSKAAALAAAEEKTRRERAAAAKKKEKKKHYNQVRSRGGGPDGTARGKPESPRPLPTSTRAQTPN